MSLHQVIENGCVFEIGSLKQRLEGLSDKRKRRGVRYRLTTILLMIVLAKMAGEDTVRGIATWLRLRSNWLISALQLPGRSSPHHTTISRVLSNAIDVEEFDLLIGSFCHDLTDERKRTQREAAKGVRKWAIICIDGKTLRGSIAIGSTQGVHLLAAWDPEAGFVLMQLEVDTKENEIVVAPRLLGMLSLEGRVVIGDAMQTQRTISVEIVTTGGHFIWFVKNNQSRLRQAIERLFTEPEMRPGHHAIPTDFQQAKTVSTGHGRIETRILIASSMLNGYVDFPNCGQVFRLERRVQHLRAGQLTKESVEVAWGITDLYDFEASPEDLLWMTRQYWGIENGLHYRRDVTFKEDTCQLRDPTAQHVMASINNLALTLLLHQPHEKTVPDERRYYAANPSDALDKMTRAPTSFCA